jgi:HSP20 family molecular chaperone IbpA
MESEFEPAVRTEETPGALIVIVDIPGFRKENLKVQIENRRDLIISGERGVKEMEEMTKVGGKLEKIQRFRKVIGVPPNWNIDERITAKFRDQTLRVSLPLLHISDQQNQETIPASGKPVQSEQSKDERSSPVGKQDSMQEQSGVAQNDQRARYPEAIRRDDNKAKGSAAAEESKGLVEGNKTEASKLAQDFVHGEPPTLKGAQAVSAEAGARDQSQFIQSKSKEDEEESDDDEEEADEEAAAAEDEDKGEGDECSLPIPNDEFPEQQLRNPYCTRRSRLFTRCCIVL